MSTAGTLTRRQQANILGLFACLVLFYFWTAATGRYRALPGENLGYYYNHLARAFMAGQTSLLLQPSPQLLLLPDPYDPARNATLRMHDAVLFKGKYYLYYGPTPALVLFVPFRIVTGMDLSEPWAVAILCSLGLFYSFRLLLFLCRTYLPDTPFWLLMAAVPALGFGNMAPFLLRRPLHYEVAISGGYAFAVASLYYFVSGSLGERVRKRAIVVGSLFLGLAGGARFPMFAAGLVALVLAAYIIAKRREQPLRDHMTTLLAFFAPAATCLFLLGLYNYVRFDSWTEFGMRYTLQGYLSARTYVFYSLARVPAGLFYYLLVPPHFLPQFPFIFPDPAFYALPPHDYYLESLIGILPNVPLLGMLFMGPAFWPTFRRWLPMYLVAGAMCAVGAVLLGLVCFTAGTMRYEMDFATFFLIPALLLWCIALTTFRPGEWGRRVVATAFVVTLVGTMMTGGAISTIGYYDDLKVGSPATYLALKNFFAPLERWFGGGP